MIQIPRSLVHQFRAIVRRLVRRQAGTSAPAISFEAGPEGLRIRLHYTEVGVEFHQPGALASDWLALSPDALADFEGRKDDLVSLESNTGGLVSARWQDGLVPQVREYQQPDPETLADLPTYPAQVATNEPDFLKGLADAAQSATRDTTRYALDHIELRGKSGEIVATDGKQLLIQSGFHFPWQENVLIPASPVLGSRELPRQEQVTVGRTEKHVTIRVGGWTLHFPIDLHGRFPPADAAIPSLNGSITRWHIDPADAEFLAKALPRLPGKDQDHSPITVDLDGQIAIRARASGQERVTELQLAQSQFTGKPVRFSINRHLLARGLELGLGEVCIVSADKPVVFQDERRRFVAMPLGKDDVLPASDNALRIASATEGQVGKPAPVAKEETVTHRPQADSSIPITNGVSKATRNGTKPEQRKPSTENLGALVEEVEALKNDLRQVYTRTHHLLAGIKKHRRQNKLVQSTLAALRQLKSVAG